MYDRQTESWWQEFNGEAIVGDLTRKRLELIPLSIISWGEFKTAHPEGKVLSQDTGHSRSYGKNPYYLYDSASSPFLYVGPEDSRLQALERVVGIWNEKESLAVPYSVLEKEGIVRVTLGGQDLAIFFKKGTASALDSRVIAEGRDVGAVGVFESILDGKKLSFKKEGDNILDVETATTWNLLGEAQSGPLAGKTLTPVVHLNSFWFAWAVFRPETNIHRGN